MSGISLLSAFSTITGILSKYFSRILAASAFLFSRSCSCLKELLAIALHKATPIQVGVISRADLKKERRSISSEQSRFISQSNRLGLSEIRKSDRDVAESLEKQESDETLDRFIPTLWHGQLKRTPK
eukprot:c12385_g1_i1 orf=544-924(+)